MMEILLGINVVAHDASAIEESNALALAIVPSGSAVAPTFDSGVFFKQNTLILMCGSLPW